MLSLQLITVVLAVTTLGNAEKLLRIKFRDRGDSERLQKLAFKRNLDIWTITKRGAELEVPDSGDVLKEIASNFTAKVVLDNVQQEVDERMAENKDAEKQSKRFRSEGIITSFFPTYDQITTWTAKLAKENAFVSVEKIGKSYQGRMMEVVRISSGGVTNDRKPAVFVTGGIHAREWLGVASVIYTMDMMIKYKQVGDRRISKLLEKYDFYFSPVINPDGYAYTFRNGYTRKWRKTRQPHGRRGCIGGDPNRNWDVYFGQRGASRDPCHIIYPGPYAFSEPCVRNVRDFALSAKMRNRIQLYYDVHAYSQMYFVPFAFNSQVKPADDAELRRVAEISNAALQRVNGRNFELGTPGEILYDASGSTMDWFKLKAGVKYSYAFEVFPTQWSSFGFLAKPEHIAPSGKEISEAIFTAAENIRV